MLKQLAIHLRAWADTARYIWHQLDAEGRFMALAWLAVAVFLLAGTLSLAGCKGSAETQASAGSDANVSQQDSSSSGSLAEVASNLRSSSNLRLRFGTFPVLVPRAVVDTFTVTKKGDTTYIQVPCPQQTVDCPGITELDAGTDQSNTADATAQDSTASASSNTASGEAASTAAAECPPPPFPWAHTLIACGLGLLAGFFLRAFIRIPFLP